VVFPILNTWQVIVLRLVIGRLMRFLELRISQMPRAGFSTEDLRRGGFWIFWKRWLDANVTIQGKSGTRELDESRDGSCASASYRSLLGEDEPGSFWISDENFYS
jgi:hypothetical protein